MNRGVYSRTLHFDVKGFFFKMFQIALPNVIFPSLKLLDLGKFLRGGGEFFQDFDRTYTPAYKQ